MANTENKNRYYEGLGRRKTAVARVRFNPSDADPKKSKVVVNEKPYNKYFSTERYQENIISPLKVTSAGGKIEVKVKGGGVNAQSEAIRLGLSRALVKFNKDYKKKLKLEGYLTRDSRMVERKKYGRRKARRGHQWRKR